MLERKIDLLKKGDTIAIINTSFKNSNPKNSLLILDKLKELGYKIKIYKTFYLEKGYFAGSDEERINDINEAFRDKEVKAILCMCGGYGLTRIVDKLDYEAIRNNPKLIIGYSDITALINAIYFKCSFSTIHGIVGATLKGIDNDSLKCFLDLITNKTKGKVLKNIKNEMVSLVDGIVEGELVGGNMSLIDTLAPSSYKVDFTDKIVFIEDVGEAAYRIDRYFSALKLSGELDKAKGFVFGYFTNCEEYSNVKVIDVIKEYILPLNKPTLLNFESGHELPFVSFPIGARVRLDTYNKTITILEEIYNED